MNYVTLAAGKGTRMDNLGSYLQKCMYPVYGIPFLRYSLDNLINSGTFSASDDTITVVTGHLGEQIRSYFGQSYRKISLSYVEQEEAKGTGHAVYTAAEAENIESPFVVWLADTYVSSHMFDNVRMAMEDSALTITSHICEEEHNERVDVDHSEQHITTAWKGSSNFIEAGLWKVSPELVGKMLSRKEDEYRFLPAVQEAIDEGLNVSAVHTDEWIHLGGTEPTVRENLIHVTQRLLAELREEDI